jgi:hypothetical protein
LKTVLIIPTNAHSARGDSKPSLLHHANKLPLRHLRFFAFFAGKMDRNKGYVEGAKRNDQFVPVHGTNSQFVGKLPKIARKLFFSTPLVERLPIP